MKNVLNKLTLFGAYALLAASCLPAQSGPKLIVNVPFDFMVKNQHFAAGSYTLITDREKAVVYVRGEERTVAALTIATETLKVTPNGKLVFNCYGDRIFLSQVWLPGRTDGGQLVPCKAELELASKGAKPEIVALLISGGRPHIPTH